VHEDKLSDILEGGMKPKLVCANFSFLTCYDQFIMHIFGWSNCIIVTAANNLCLLHEKEPSTLGFTVCVPHVFQFPCILFLTDAIQALLQFWGGQYKVFDPTLSLIKLRV